MSRRRQRVRDEILESAREVILRDGIGAVTLSAIAEKLELTKAALYYYFDSKDSLLFEIVYETMLAEVEAIEERVAEASDGAEAIEGIIRGCSEHYAGDLDSFRLVYLAGQVGATIAAPPGILEKIRPFNERLYGGAERLIEADRAAGRIPESVAPRRTAFLAHCAAIGVFTYEGLVAISDDP
ncbi:MAG: TetR/AcrR family transcriptional regulator, partial [Thermoanaerobaculia bacterium]|nr:TetR/AcrR family transcriptional regulator [Thermoanaerobaculia bacterium]